MKKEISFRIKNYYDINETFKKLKQKFSDFMEQMNFFNDEITKIKKRYTKYPDQLSNLAQNEIDLIHIEKIIKSKNIDLQLLANMSKKFYEFLNINVNILNEFKKNNNNGALSEPSGQDGCKIIDNFFIDAKNCYESLLKNVGQIKTLNNNLNMSSSIIISIEAWFRSIELKYKDEIQKIILFENKEELDQTINNLMLISDEINQCKISIKKLENTEQHTSIIFENLTNSFFNQKWEEFSSQLKCIETKVSNAFDSLSYLQMTIIKYNNYLDENYKIFDNLQLNENLCVNNIDIIIENLEKLNSDLKEKIHELNTLKFDNKILTENLNKNIFNLSQKVLRKFLNYIEIKQIVKSYESNMQHIQMLIDEKDNKNEEKNFNIDLVLENLNEEKNKLEIYKIEILDNVIKSCLEEIELKYVPEILEKEKIKFLTESFQEKNLQLNEKINLITNKIEYFLEIKTRKLRIFNLVERIDNWIFYVEEKLSEPIGKNFDELEAQFEINEEILSELDKKLIDIEELNNLNLNLTNFVCQIKKDDIYHIDYICDFKDKQKQINIKFDSIGKKLNDRKAIILKYLDKLKNIEEELDIINNRSQELKLNLLQINNSIVANNIDSFEHLNHNFLEDDFLKLKLDFDCLKKRIEKDQDEKIKYNFQNIDTNIICIESILLGIKNFINERKFDILNFEKQFTDIYSSIKENQSKINKIIVDIKYLLMHQENAEFELIEYNKTVKEINLQEKKIKEFNELVKKKFNSKNELEKLIEINSNYDILVKSYESTSYFLKYLINLMTDINNIEETFVKKSSEIKDLMDNCVNEDFQMENNLKKIELMENSNLKNMDEFLEKLENNQRIIIDCINNFYLTELQQNIDSNDLIICRKIEKFIEKIQKIKFNFSLFKKSILQYSIERNNFDETKSVLLNLFEKKEKELFEKSNNQKLIQFREKKDYSMKIRNELNEYNQILQNLIKINNKIERFNSEKPNYLNRKAIVLIQQNYSNLLEKVNSIEKNINLSEDCLIKIKKFEVNFDIFNKGIMESLDHYDDIESIEKCLLKFNCLIKTELAPILTELNETNMEMIKTELDQIKIKIETLKAKLENKKTNIQQQNQKIIRNNLEVKKSVLDSLEKEIDLNLYFAKNDLIKRIEETFSDETKSRANLKADDPLMNEIDKIERWKNNLLEKIEEKFSILNQLQNLESRFNDIDRNLQNDVQNLENLNSTNYLEKIDSLNRAYKQLEIIQTESRKVLQDSLNNFENKESKSKLNQSSDSFEKRIKEIIERCDFLKKLSTEKEKVFKEKVDNLLKIEEKIEQFVNQLKTSNTELDYLLKNLELLEKDELKKKFEEIIKKADYFKSELDQYSNEIKILDIKISLEYLEDNLFEFEDGLQKFQHKMEFSNLKNCEYERKVFDLEQNLVMIENELDLISKVKYNFSNLDFIESNLTELDLIMKKLVYVSNEIDEFKEFSEKILQNFSFNDSNNFFEINMDSIIHKLNQMTRKINERRSNCIFLNIHLRNLANNYQKQISYLESLESNSSCKLVLSCADPFVIKYQIEKMKTIYDNLNQRTLIISDLKQDTKQLTRLNQDFETQLNLLKSDQIIDCDNKYIEFLPKSVSIASLNNLVNLLDSDEIFKTILLLENKSLYLKDFLNSNLNIFKRLYPKCENLSLNLSNLNQSITIIESDIEWLENSNENEISLKDKENLFEKTYQCILRNEKSFEKDIQISLCSNIIDEINSKNIECNNLIDDINKNIEETGKKLILLNDKYNKAYQNFQKKQKNSREIYSEMNDILEWLDLIESKYSDFNFVISQDISEIEKELKKQIIFNDEVNGQKLELRKIDLKNRQKIRHKEIEDSIEFKEKLVNIQFQLDNYIEIGINRVNRLEEALIVSKELKLIYETFIKSMFMIQERLNFLESFNLINSGIEFREILSNKMILMEEIEFELLEKKSDLEILKKNFNNLIKICENPKSLYVSKFSIQSSDTIFEDLQCYDNHSNFESKKIIDFANQTYNNIKIDFEIKKDELENLLWNSGDLWDKIDNLNSFLKIKVDFIESNKIISVHPDKINFKIKDLKNILDELDKRKKSLNDAKECCIKKAGNTELNEKMKDLEIKWSDFEKMLRAHEKNLRNAFDTSELFWNNYNYINELISDLDERLLSLESESVAIDSDSIFEQQQYHQQIIKDIDENEAKLIDIKTFKQQLIEISTFSDLIEIEKAIENCEKSWNRIKEKVKKHEIDIQITFSKACEFQQELIEILEWISLQQEKFVNLDSSFNSDDPKTIRFQINLLKEFKEKVDPKQMEILILNQKFDELKFNIRTNQSFEVLESLQEPLNSANKEWKRLQSSITDRKSNLKNLLIDMGQLNDALDEIAKSIDSNLNSLDNIEFFFTPNNDIQIRSVDLKVARLKMIGKEIKSEEYLLTRLKDKCGNLFINESLENETNPNELKAKVISISEKNELMKKKFEELKENYDKELAQSLSLFCELIDNLEWLKDIDDSLDNNFLYGGLPETAREEIAKFKELSIQIESRHCGIDNLLRRAFECNEKNLLDKKLDNMLKDATENLSNKWTLVLKKISDKKEILEISLNKACAFNEKYHELVDWLNETEKCFKSFKSFAKIESLLDEQIKAHQELQISINKQRENILELNRIGTHLKYYCQKQDSILIKNLMVSVQNRWDKIVSKSSNRTRDLERGYQDVKIFNVEWNKINEWLDSNINILLQSTNIGNNSIKIKQQIAKHADFHRIINSWQTTYDRILKSGRKLLDKCDQDSKDQIFIQEMLQDIKNKWKILCIQSVERQKKLEEGLLYSGQFQDALSNLVEWLKRVKPTLSKNETLFGDLDNVMALTEDNQQFQKSLQIKAEQLVLINKAANEMINTNDNDDDFKLTNEKLKEVNELWDDVDFLSKDRTKRLDESLKIATEFNQSVRCCLEWLKNTELTIKQDWQIFDENEISFLIEDHQDFIKYLNENKQMIIKCLDLGNRLLENCIPEATNNLTHFVSIIQNKWDEIYKLSEEKLMFLNEALENFKKYDNLLNELITWLLEAEIKLNALDQEPLSNNLEIIDQQLKNQVEFQIELEQKQVDINIILKNSLTNYDSCLLNKMIDTKSIIFEKKNRYEWKILESKITSSRIKLMIDKWRNVLYITFEHQKKLKEFSERLKEIEKLKEFNFDEWRQKFMDWHKDNRARITDFFRRQDKDHDGKISRDEFVKGIMNTSINQIKKILFFI